MPGHNCAFFGCPTSQKHKISLFRIPVVSAHESEYTSSVKKQAREKWLEIILRTREVTPELKKRIANNIYVCIHFKDECISKGECACIYILRFNRVLISVICHILLQYANVYGCLDRRYNVKAPFTRAIFV